MQETTAPQSRTQLLPASASTMIASAHPNGNYGRYPGPWLKTNGINRGLVRFDLSGLIDRSPRPRIVSAIIRVRVYDGVPTSSQAVYCARLEKQDSGLPEWQQGDARAQAFVYAPGGNHNQVLPVLDGSSAGATWHSPLDPNTCDRKPAGPSWEGGEKCFLRKGTDGRWSTPIG